MSHPMSKILVSTAIAAALCVTVYGAVAVLNASQGPDLDLDSLLGDDAPAANPAQTAADAVAEAADDTADAAAAAADKVADASAAATEAVDAAADAAPAAATEAVDAVADAAPAATDDLSSLLGDAAPAPAADAAPAAADVQSETPAEPAVEAEPVAVVETVAQPAALFDDDPAPVVEAKPAPLFEAAPGVGQTTAVAAPATAPVAAPPAAPVLTEEEKLVDEMANLAKIRRVAQTQHGISEYNAAMQDLKNGLYDRAIRHFEQSRQFLSQTALDPKGRRYDDLAEQNLGEAHYRNALLLERLGNPTEARKHAVMSAQLGHPKGQELVAHLNDIIENPPEKPEPPRVQRQNQPEFLKDQKAFRDKLNRAREFYGTGEYDKAREQIEMVLHDSPFNSEAVTLLRRLENRRYDFVNHEFEATRETMIRQVKEIWTPRTYATEVSASSIRGGGDNIVSNTLDSVAIERKLKSIMIPEINFRQANLTDVITFLSDASRENDTENTTPDRKGINFILQTSSSTQSAAEVTDDPFGAPAADVGASAGGAPTFTFSAHYVPLKDVLDIVMSTGNLKYRIRSNMVVIMDKNSPETELQFRAYPVLPDIEQKVTSFSDSNDSGNDIIGMGSPTIQSGTSDWKESFRKYGVEWPEGSSVEYMRGVGRLMVRNTVENLANLETVLAYLNVTPKQIEIEARFVEVSQNDLDSLGLEWNLNNNWEMLEHKKDAGLPIDQRRRIVMKSGSLTSGFGYLSENTKPDINGGSSIADNIVTIGSVLTNPELSLVLHMLSSRQNTDLLSAPKVVTKNNQEATIKVVTEYIYPTEYEVNMLNVQDDNGNDFPMGAVVEPNNFQTREVGVQLTVMPSVSDDGQIIDLTLAPQVVSEPTWKNYGSTYPMMMPDGNYAQAQLNMEQPFFPVRSITTSLQIFNGATVVMGGMITEIRNSREDKVPFLGDIPLVGRLFRNKYESSEKRNLLIFVSARLVDGAGRFVPTIEEVPLMMETNAAQ